jgi:hypothetical protein
MPTCSLHGAANITQDDYMQLQQAAAYICSPEGPFGTDQLDEVERCALLALLMLLKPGVKVQECLVTRGPLPFHIVRQVRCCILLYECLAAALAVAGLCSSLMQQKMEGGSQEQLLALLLQGAQGCECNQVACCVTQCVHMLGSEGHV